MKHLRRVYVPQFLAPGANKVLVCFGEPQNILYGETRELGGPDGDGMFACGETARLSGFEGATLYS